MSLRFYLIFFEVVLITILDYKLAERFYSLDVLYCLPVIQAARSGALRTLYRSDSSMHAIIAVLCALAWSLAEAAVTWPHFPINAFLLNTFTRAVTFTVIGRVIVTLWKEKEYSRIDSLTGLANRLEFMRRFEDTQLHSQRTDKPYSLLSVNIDHFRVLNEKHGHKAGDEALKVLADILKRNSRSIDIVARISSDEFVLLLPESGEKSCDLLINRIVAGAEKKFNRNGWDISLSTGYITEVGKKRGVEELLRAANEKMRLNKASKSHLKREVLASDGPHNSSENASLLTDT